MAIEEMDDAVDPAVDPKIQFQGKQQFFWVAKGTRLLSEDERVAKAPQTFMVKPYSPTNPKSGPEYLKNLRMFATLGSTKDTHGIAMHVSNKEMGPEHMSGWEFQNGEKAISFTAALEGEEDKVKLKYDKRNARFCSHALIVWLRTCEPFQARLEELIAENPNGHYTRLKDIIFEEGRVYLKASQVKDIGTITVANNLEPPTSIPPDVPPSDAAAAEDDTEDDTEDDAEPEPPPPPKKKKRKIDDAWRRDFLAALHRGDWLDPNAALPPSVQRKKEDMGAGAVAFGSTPAVWKALGADEHKPYAGRVVSLLHPQDGVHVFDKGYFPDPASGVRCRYFAMTKAAFDQMLREAGRTDPATLRRRVHSREDMTINYEVHKKLWKAGWQFNQCYACDVPLIDPSDPNVFAEKAQKIVQIVRE